VDKEFNKREHDAFNFGLAQKFKNIGWTINLIFVTKMLTGG
jgi:hypothetical protein